MITRAARWRIAVNRRAQSRLRVRMRAGMTRMAWEFARRAHPSYAYQPKFLHPQLASAEVDRIMGWDKPRPNFPKPL